METPRTQPHAAGFAGRAWITSKTWAAKHKWWSALILVLVLGGGYYAYAAATTAPTTTRYVTSDVASGTIVATLTETGQVSASQELTLSPQASGEVTAVYVTSGQHVAAGQIVAQLDGSDAETALQNAELSLQNEQIQYQQATASSTLALNLLQAQNAVTTGQIALEKEHDSAYASIAGIYSDLSATMTGLDSALHDSDAPGRSAEENEDAYVSLVSSHDATIGVAETTAENSYQTALTAYDTASNEYKAASLSASDDDIVTLAQETYTAAEAVAQAVKDTNTFYTRVSTDESLNDYKSDSVLAGLVTNTNGYETTVGNDLATALSIQSDIVSAEQTVAQAQNALQTAEGGSNTLTVQQANLALEQAQQAVATAKENLADYSVVAPFSGTVVSVGVQKYDQASSGTTVATLVTDNQTVDISVNEVDAAKLQVGQKATLTFDALPNVTIAGTVSQVNTLGTVSSGVVSYSATITFDTPNPSVLPGMSATADIITNTGSGLVVPSSAVKTTGGSSYVQVFNPPLASSDTTTGGIASDVAPTRVPVTTGLSNTTQVLITSGLTAGEQVVTSTISSTETSTKSTAAASTSLLGGARAGGAGGAAFGGARAGGL